MQAIFFSFVTSRNPLLSSRPFARNAKQHLFATVKRQGPAILQTQRETMTNESAHQSHSPPSPRLHSVLITTVVHRVLNLHEGVHNGAAAMTITVLHRCWVWGNGEDSACEGRDDGIADGGDEDDDDENWELAQALPVPDPLSRRSHASCHSPWAVSTPVAATRPPAALTDPSMSSMSTTAATRSMPATSRSRTRT